MKVSQKYALLVDFQTLKYNHTQCDYIKIV